MLNINTVTKEDMLLIKDIFPFSSASQVPFAFSLGEKSYKGITEEFSPCIERVNTDSQCIIDEITGINKSGFMVRARKKQYLDFPVVEWTAFATNRARSDSEIFSSATVGGFIKGTNPVISCGNGDTRDEKGFKRASKKLDEPMFISPSGGRGSEGASPFITISFQEYSVILAVGWPGSWMMAVVPCENGVKIALGQKRCSMRIKPLETMRTPSLTILTYKGDENRGTNLWRKFYLKHIMPCEADGQKLNPRMFLHTFGIDGKNEFCGITTENQINAIDEYLKRGAKPDAWWIDAGWYSCDFDWWKTGDWYPNPEQLPDGFRPISDKLHENNIDLLVWFEPERILENSKFFYQHPEWLLRRKKEDGEEDICCLVNYADKDCLEYIIDMLDNMIKVSGIDIYRQDFNFDPMPFWTQNEAPDRTGALENLHVQGVLKLFDELLARNPGLVIDCCASGGTRNDLDTLRRAVPLQYTDVGLDTPEIKQVQYLEMFRWIPYFRSHAQDRKNGKLLKDEYAYLTAFAPAMTSMLEYYDSDKDFRLFGKMESVWRKAAEMQLKGDFYPLYNPDGEWYAVQFDVPEEKAGFIQVIRNAAAKKSAIDVKPFIRADEKYVFTNALTNEEKRADGAGLETGLSFYSSARRGEIWFYKSEVKEN